MHLWKREPYAFQKRTIGSTFASILELIAHWAKHSSLCCTLQLVPSNSSHNSPPVTPRKQFGFPSFSSNKDCSEVVRSNISFRIGLRAKRSYSVFPCWLRVLPAMSCS